MPVSGDKITAPSYNTIRNTFINSLTAGSGSTGYGQTANSSAVAQGQKVRQTDWANLVLDIRRMANHQGTTVTLPTITSGTKVSAAQANQIQTAATTVVAPGNVFQLAEFSDELLASSSRGTAWNATIRHFFTVTFNSANDARYFFNAGSTIRIRPTFTKSSSTTINNDWELLISTLGTVIFGHTATSANGSSPGTGSNIGFYDLTNSPQQIYTKGGTSYAANDYTIRAYCNVANNSSGGATIVYFECYFNDDKGPNPNFDESVTGTVTNTARMFRASGANVAVLAPAGATTTNL